MSQFEKLLGFVMSGQHDKSFHFQEIRGLMLQLGFRERIRGDHFIYTKAGIIEKINIQPNGNMAKPYQVKQIRGIILKYRLGAEKDV